MKLGLPLLQVKEYSASNRYPSTRHGKQKKIEALINDPTENQFVYRNLYVVGKIKKSGGIYSDIDSLKNAILTFETKIIEIKKARSERMSFFIRNHYIQFKLVPPSLSA